MEDGRVASSGSSSRRVDAGLARATERDLALLRVVAEQYAVTLPQLAVLMDRTVHTAPLAARSLAPSRLGREPDGPDRKAGVRVADPVGGQGGGSRLSALAPDAGLARACRGGDRRAAARRGHRSRGAVDQ